MTTYPAGHYPSDQISYDVYAARQALTDGLIALRGSMRELSVQDALSRSMRNMLSLAVRGEGGAGNRTRTRPQTNNEGPGRHATGTNTKPASGRGTNPGRPAMPAQPGPNEADPGLGEADTTDTVAIASPAVTGDRPAGASGSSGGFPNRPDPTDAAAEVWALVERAQAGESAAFGLIYDRYVDTVFRFVYFRVGNRQLAEDLTSDTFLRALKRIGSFTWQGRDLGAWLVTIARNLVADHFKSGRYRLEVTTGDVLDADREDRGPEGSPEAAVVDHITNVALLTAVKQLNPEQQECIVLRFLQGFSVAETAQAMGKNEGAIKALQYRAVRALARLLPDGFQP
jgi:RNA polymerase sigma-70 factor (ECF subfamily)